MTKKRECRGCRNRDAMHTRANARAHTASHRAEELGALVDVLKLELAASQGEVGHCLQKEQEYAAQLEEANQRYWRAEATAAKSASVQRQLDRMIIVAEALAVRMES